MIAWSASPSNRGHVLSIKYRQELKTTIEQPTSQTHVTDSRARFSTFVNAIISKRGNLVRAKPQTTCIVKTSRRPNRAPLNRCLNNDVTFEPNIDPRDYNTTWAGTKSNRIQCSLVKKAGTLSRRSGGKKKKNEHRRAKLQTESKRTAWHQTDLAQIHQIRMGRGN